MFAIRRATLADAEAVTSHRRAMFHEMGYREAPALDVMAARVPALATAKVDHL